MRLPKAVLLVPVLLVLFAGSAFAKGAPPQRARLDPSFGRHGSFTTATSPAKGEEGQPITVPAHLALAPGGRSYVQRWKTLVAFGANGKPDPGFGKNGRVTVQPGPGRVTEVSGVAVDSAGRVLVAGTYEPFPGFGDPVVVGKPTPERLLGEPVTEAFVVRYLPNGRPDPSFGSAGVVVTTFGVPRPTDEPREGKTSAEYERPILRATHIGVDAEDRPVVSGSYVRVIGGCPFGAEEGQAFVGRLTANGSLDTSFDGTGNAQIPGAATVGLAAGPGGEWVSLGENPPSCEHRILPRFSKLAVLDESGAPSALDPARPELDANGALAIDPQGRILYAEEESPESFGERTGQPKLVRLLPNGDVDPSFGHDGGIILGRFTASPPAIAIDGKGRIVVGFGEKRLEHTPLTPAGKLEGKFGNHGLLYSPRGAARLTALAIDSKGRILVAGSDAVGKTGEGIEIARFLPGS
jgi:uncharacterized delta-60 repeat protein